MGGDGFVSSREAHQMAADFRVYLAARDREGAFQDARRGLQAHPDGPAAGVRALQLWWEAAVEGLSVEQSAAKYPLLAAALAKFGK